MFTKSHIDVERPKRPAPETGGFEPKCPELLAEATDPTPQLSRVSIGDSGRNRPKNEEAKSNHAVLCTGKEDAGLPVS